MISFLIEENESIKNFLEGSNDYIPVSEFKYLHERPLLRPNFLTQIDDLVRETGEKMIERNISGAPIEHLTKVAVVIGQQLEGEMTDTKAERALFALRDLYKFCTQRWAWKLNDKIK